MQPSSSWHWLRPSGELSLSLSWLCNRRQSQGTRSTQSDSETAVQKLFCTESETRALDSEQILPGIRNYSSQLNNYSMLRLIQTTLSIQNQTDSEQPTQDAEVQRWQQRFNRLRLFLDTARTDEDGMYRY